MNYLKQELYDLIQSDDTVFDFLQNSSLDGLWYWDLENPEEEWMNRRFWETLGYDPDEMPHKAAAWQDIIHPDDLELAKENVTKHLTNANEPYDQEVRYQHKNGSTVWIRCRGLAVRDKNGIPKRMLGAHVDITKQKRIEQLLTETNRVARVGAWEVDVKNEKLYWSEVTKEIHEVGHDYEPVLAEAINFYKNDGTREYVTRVVEEGNAAGRPWDFEAKIITAKGREIWVRAIGQAEILNGEVNRLYGVFQDIDERKKNEEKLRRLSILESKSKEMSQFAYVASHDLREPLLTIQGFAEVLEEDHGADLNEEGKAHLQVILQAARRMDALIHGLLDYSRLSQVKQLQKVNISKVLASVQTDLHATINKNQAEIRIPTHLPELYGYPLELKMVFQNLISNAIKFKKLDEAPLIEIEYQELSEGWQFSISDNGIGMRQKDLKQIFHLFKRLHSKQRYTGTGIGLANCKKIIELHNGKIWATSKLNKGSTFHFTILTKQK